MVRIINPSSGFITINNFLFAAPTFKEYLTGQPHNWLDSILQTKIKARKFSHKYTPSSIKA